MTTRTDPQAAALIRVFALAWPLGVYAGAPFTSLDLVHVLAWVLGALFLTELRRRPRVPFELLWPAVLVPALCAIHGLRTGATFDYTLPTSFTLFLAVHHFIRDRDSALACMRLSAASGVCAAGLTVAGWAGFTLPTAYPVPSPVEMERVASLFRFSTLSSARDIPHGLATFAVCGVACAHFALTSRNWARRAKWASAAVIVTVALAGPCLWLFTIPGHVPYREFAAPVSPTVAATALLVTWFVARIAAKLIVDRAENGAKATSPFLWVMAAALPFVLVLPVRVGPEHLFLLGLVAAFTRARAAAAETPGYLPWSYAALAAVFVVNIVHVFPSNSSDPRNYAPRTHADIRAGEHDRAWNRLALVERWRQHERRTHMLRAGILLDLGYPNWAAEEFRESCRARVGLTVLPGPSEEELEAFVSRLRDYCSGIPLDRRGYAYESALSARGRGDTSFPLLFDAPAEGGGAHAESSDADFLAKVLVHLLKDDSLATPLADRSGTELLRALETRGARVRPLPSPYAGEGRPVAIVVQRTSGGASIWALRDEVTLDATITVVQSFPRHVDARWLESELVRGEDGGHVVHLSFTDGTAIGGIVLDIDRGGQQATHECLSSLPDAPGVFIWLP